MIVKIIELTNGQNWGKFLIGQLDHEWNRRSLVDPESKRPLLSLNGWGPDNIWVLDLQTGEGAYFYPKGYAQADLQKHEIWVCPMYQPFLTWLYRQDLSNITTLPDLVTMTPEETREHTALWGHRRKGKQSLRPDSRQFLVEQFASVVHDFFENPTIEACTVAEHVDRLRNVAEDLDVNFDQIAHDQATAAELAAVNRQVPKRLKVKRLKAPTL